MLLTIEKLIYGGDGLARLTADDRGRGKAVFVPFVLGGEKIDAILTEEKPGFARARALGVLEPSAHRAEPACPYFARCGGCHYQHAAYEHQLEIKKGILRENLRRIAKLDLKNEIEVHPSPPWNYRNRSRFQVRTRPSFVAGYFKFASHEVEPVEQCPISSPLINRGLAALWQTARAGKISEAVREIEFFANPDDTQLLVELSSNSAPGDASLRSWAEELRAELPQIIGVVAFQELKPGADSPAASQLLAGAGHLAYNTAGAVYRVSAGAFFQTNRYLTDELVNIVTRARSGDVAVDLYAGVGLFSTALARNFRHIVSVESSHRAIPDLQYNLPPNGEAVQATTEQYLIRNNGKERVRNASWPSQRPDLIVIDPPRSGMGERDARALASQGGEHLTYVSCDPATLARDLMPLLAAGYRVERAHLVDLFPQTYHLESVLQLTR